MAELFWDEGELQNGRHCLRTTLWGLRSALESNLSTNAYLLIEGSQIRFSPESDYWFDAEEFEQKVSLVEGIEPASMNKSQRLALEEAVKLYRGCFLDGFYDD